MKLPLTHSFGDVRALLQQEPSAPAWSLLCTLLDTWSNEAEDALEEEVLPYVLQHTARWPAALRSADLKVARRTHEIARKIAAELLDDAQLGEFRGALLGAMEALWLRGQRLVASAGWVALAQVRKLTTELDGEAFELVAALPGLRWLHTPLVIAPGELVRLARPGLEQLSLTHARIPPTLECVGAGHTAHCGQRAAAR
jgi:hypothetical protein